MNSHTHPTELYWLVPFAQYNAGELAAFLLATVFTLLTKNKREEGISQQLTIYITQHSLCAYMRAYVQCEEEENQNNPTSM